MKTMIIKTKMGEEKVIKKMQEVFEHFGYEFDVSPNWHLKNSYDITFGKELLFKIHFKESLIFSNKIIFAFNKSNISNSMLILMRKNNDGIKKFLGAIDYYTLVAILRYTFENQNNFRMEQLRDRVEYLRETSLEGMSDEFKYSKKFFGERRFYDRLDAKIKRDTTFDKTLDRHIFEFAFNDGVGVRVHPFSPHSRQERALKNLKESKAVKSELLSVLHFGDTIGYTPYRRIDLEEALRTLSKKIIKFSESKIITKHSLLEGIQSSHEENENSQDFIIEGLDSVINNNLVDEDIAKEAIKIKEMYEKKQEEAKQKKLKEDANNEALQVLQAVKMHLEMRGDSLE